MACCDIISNKYIREEGRAVITFLTFGNILANIFHE
jgi:hypothetical protein